MSPRSHTISALSNPRCRLACRYFVESDETVAELSDLVDYVVCQECQHGGEVPGDHRTEVTIQLYHVHLPKLAETDVLEFDPRSRIVRYRGDDLVEELLRVISDDEKVCA